MDQKLATFTILADQNAPLFLNQNHQISESRDRPRDQSIEINVFIREQS